MSALLLLLLGGLWAAALYSSAYLLTFFIPKKWIRQMIGAVAVVSLFTLPLRDEIKGAEEFEALCKTGGVYQISPNAVGKKFDLRYSYSENKSLSGFTRPVEESIKTFVDVATGEVVATAKAYFAGGGWLVRSIGRNPLTGGNGPLIGREQCLPPSNVEQVQRLQAITNKIID